jgi:hypothetical protein
MGRVAAILIFIASLWLYVNWQYRRAMHAVTSPNATTGMFSTTRTPWSTQRQESRTKCMICNGTGRSGFYAPGMTRRGGVQNSKPCSSCRGTGWIDNPMYGH